jgi:hypothetical protein
MYAARRRGRRYTVFGRGRANDHSRASVLQNGKGGNVAARRGLQTKYLKATLNEVKQYTKNSIQKPP